MKWFQVLSLLLRTSSFMRYAEDVANPVTFIATLTSNVLHAVKSFV